MLVIEYPFPLLFPNQTSYPESANIKARDSEGLFKQNVTLRIEDNSNNTYYQKIHVEAIQRLLESEHSFREESSINIYNTENKKLISINNCLPAMIGSIRLLLERNVLHKAENSGKNIE